MGKFISTLQQLGTFTFPEFSGVRIMMMPILLEDQNSIPDTLAGWKEGIASLISRARCQSGVGYLTIDEMHVPAGKTHRRPGLHVDGVGPNGEIGGWGGGYGTNGMLLVASHLGCRVWDQEFDGVPLPNGDCSHLASQCKESFAVDLEPNKVYWLNGNTVHLPLAFEHPVARQFVRLSMPSDAPWYEGYTANPTGVLPSGPIHASRPAEFMAGRS